jgi:Tol biopolymer transport system component
MSKLPFFGAVIVLFAAASAVADPLITERVNVDPVTGMQADGISYSPVLSADGCVVAFVSQSSTLAPPSYGLTTDSPPQVYAVDRCVTPHTLELISVTDDGTTAADRDCAYPNISADGRYVSFVSSAGNLPVPGSAPSGEGNFVFVRDRVAGTTLSPLEAWRVTSNTIAGVGFNSSPNRYMSSDATRFAFDFYNSVSVPSNTYEVDFSGAASTLQPLCPTASLQAAVPCTEAQISGDGSTVVFDTSYPIVASDVDGFSDVFSYDIATATSALVSVNANGTQANHDVNPYGDLNVSGDGHLVAFSSDEATDFPGATIRTLLLKNMTTGDLTLISAASDGTPESITEGVAAPQLSDDGNRLAFNSDNADLAPHPFKALDDVLVADLTLGRLGSACISASGSYGRVGCDGAAISADGKWMAFRSNSENLVPNDTNGEPDIFVVALDRAVDFVFADAFEP